MRRIIKAPDPHGCRRGATAAMRWLLAAALLGVCTLASASGHNYYFSDINGATFGLAQNGVHVLFQDRQGFIWIGTEGGLNRFDGYTLERHVHDPGRPESLPGGLMTAMADAGDGQVWIGTQTGKLLRYEPQDKRVLQAIDGLADDMIGALFRAADGRVWVGDGLGISLLSGRPAALHQVYRTRATQRSFYATSVTGFTQCPDGTVYAASSDGLLAVSVDATERLGPPVAANDLVCNRDNQLFVTTDASVARVARGSGARTALWRTDDARTGHITRMAIDPQGNLWAAVTGTGLLRLPADGAAPRLLTPDDVQAEPLPSSQLSRILIDRSGLLWVGSTDRGVAHAPSEGSAIELLRNHDPDIDPRTANNVRAIFEDGQGRFWIGTSSAGLQQYLPATRTFRASNKALREALGRTADAPVSVHAIAAAAAGSLWLATDHGVVLFDPAHQQARRLDLGKSATERDRYRQILVDQDGSLWLAGLDSGLVHYRAGAGVIGRYSRANGLADDYVFALAHDSQKRLWVGMLRGLSLYDPITDSFRNFSEQADRPDSLAGTRVTNFNIDANGDFWIATDAGINKVLSIDAQGLHVRRILRTDGLADNMAYCVLDDHAGHLWVSGNLGLSRVDPVSGAVRAFTPAEGLQGTEFNTHSCLRDRQGHLWFGGAHGVNRLTPDAMTPSRFLPPIAITEARYGNQPMALPAGATLKVPADALVLRFAFAALDFARPAANRFRYRMVGLDKAWISNGTDSRVTYTNLKPGNYRFEVQGSNRDGAFNPTAASIKVRVLPPWWNTLPAHLATLLLAAIIIGLLWLALRRRHQTRLRHQRELHEYDQRLRLALWGSGDQFWDLDLYKKTLHRIWSDATGEAGPEQEISLGDWRRNEVHPADLHSVQRRAMAHIAGYQDRFESEHRIRDLATGQWRWVRARGQVVERDAEGNAVRMAGTSHNLERQRAEQQQRRIATSVIESMAEAVSVANLHFKFVSINPAFTRMFGYGEAEVLGKSASMLNASQHSEAMYRQMHEMIRKAGHWRGELWQRRKDGKEFLSWSEITAVHSPEGQHSHYVAVMSDITERKRTEQELRYLANYDPLSGLPNRTLLRQRLAQAIDMATRMHYRVAVLFIDLDHFKQVNDSMGHTVGDRMLEAAGTRLRANVRQTDMVARLGGDEFSVVLENIHQPSEAIEVAHSVIAAFERPLRLDSGQELITSPSIGIAIFPEHGNTPADLLKYADTAMYDAKSKGRNTWALYTAAMEARARRHAGLLNALRQALENHELSVVYQPKLDLDTWRITGVEALLRWYNPDLGQVPPMTFIPLAEEIGLIGEIGEFVLFEACSVLSEWQRHAITDVSMAVNVSAAQLLSPRLQSQLAHAIKQSGVPPQRLTLELTESLVMTHTETSMRNLRALKDLGVMLAIDDFGTGYSSLAYLKRLPVDILKIDKEFVSDITHDPDDEAITAAIISVGHSLGLELIAEGVETFEQIVYLEEKGCDAIQGNWLSPPQPAFECLALICRHDPADKPSFSPSF